VAFIDTNEGNSKPRDILLDPYVKIILASSPRGAHQKWLDQIGQATFFRKLATSLWSPRELFLTGVSAILSSFNARLIYFFRIFLDPRDITVKQLRKATMHFGYNPRLCFSNSHSEAALDGKIQGVIGHIGRLAEDSGSFLSRLKSYREGYSDGHEVSCYDHGLPRFDPVKFPDSLVRLPKTR
jgi:hypothetical protein